MGDTQGTRSSGYRLVNGAWVHERARVARDAVLEPGAVVGPDVEIGQGCWLGAQSVVYGPTVLGSNNRLYPGAVLGGAPQDLGYAGEPTRLVVGTGNTFREGVTINRGAPKAEGVTRIGDQNYFMACSHVGHDTVVESHCVFANAALIAGHCYIESYVNFAGGTAIVQFATVGRYAFLGGLAGARQDLEPFTIHDRSDQSADSRPIAINVVGLKRAGMSRETISRLRTAFRVIFTDRVPDPEEARDVIARRDAMCPEVDELLDFIRRKRAGRLGRQREPVRKSS